VTAPPKNPLAFFLSPPHACGYFDDRQAVSLFADPTATVTPAVYSRLIEHGFRRSGRHFYRPHCPHCRECLSLRIPVAAFRPRRYQRRIWQRNRDAGLKAVICEPDYRESHFELYQRYVQRRHPGGGMDDPDPSAYMNFLCGDWCDTAFVEFHHQEHLAAVAVVDRLVDGLSAVYTFFDPNLTRLGLGTYAILWQIDYARERGLDWVYLGYWIACCDKMRYKTEFKPYEIYEHGKWRHREEPS
jgi:arginine-tRNA-protein transferase